MKEGVSMNLESVHLVSQDGHYFLIDSRSLKPVILSSKAYDMLYAYKNGTDICKLKENFGSELVDEIFNEIETLRGKSIISDLKKNYYEDAENTILQINSRNYFLQEAMFMVAQDCNMACKYCYGGSSGQFNSKGLMSRQLAEEFLNYFLSVGGNIPYQKIIFLGGEPLLNMDVISYIVELWEKYKSKYNGRKLVFSLTTNGTLLTPEIVEYIKKKEIGIGISLDGPRDMHNANRVLINGQGSFDNVMDSITLLRKYDMPISIRCTVSRYTDLDRLFGFFEEHNFDNTYIEMVDYLTLHPEKDYQIDLDTYKEFEEKHRKLISKGYKASITDESDTFTGKQMSIAYKSARCGMENTSSFVCGAGRWIAAFGIDGKIYPCQKFVGKESYSIGNVQTGVDLEKVKSLYNNFLEANRSCDSCWAVFKCKRRCINQKATMDGGFKQLPEQVCDIYRESIASTIISSLELMNHMKNNRCKMEDAFLKYNTQQMMREYFQAKEGSYE